MNKNKKPQYINLKVICKCSNSYSFMTLPNNYLSNRETLEISVCTQCHFAKTQIKTIIDEKQRISKFSSKFSYNIKNKDNIKN